MSATPHRRRPKGTPKTGGATRGSVKKQTLAVKQAILETFQNLNRNNQYLNNLAESNQQLFLQLVSRILPTALDVESHTTVDIGALMIEAERRSAQISAPAPAAMIDVTPAPVPVTRVEPTGPAPRTPEPEEWDGY